MKTKWIMIIALEFLALLYVLRLLDLLDLKEVITLGVVEVGAAIFAWRLNEQSESKRIEREEEIRQKEKLEQERDEELIYQWLFNKTNLELTVGMPNDPRWRSTEEIADSTNLTDERVRTLCKSNKKIQIMRKEDVWPEKGLGEGGKKEIKPLEEKWAIKEFVKRSGK